MIADNIEVWRLIDGYDNYEVSSHGFVRNNKTGEILKLGFGSKGYRIVSLKKDGNTQNHRVHRLVASRFVENPHNYPIVDHISRDIFNNHYSNLRWATISMNSRNTSTPKNNKSGIKGVSRVSSAWVAKITGDNKQVIRKSFLMKQYGDEAKALAIEWRREKEQEYGYL